MQEQQYDRTERLTFNPSMEQMLEAAANPLNREVRIIPDLNQKDQYYVIKKKGKWVKKKSWQ